MHEADPRRSCDVIKEERVALWEELYAKPGFGKWLGTICDTHTDQEANRLYSDFMANKIRQRIHDAETADSLIPKNHGFGTGRVPLESGYFEVYNQPNIHLVDLQKCPVKEINAGCIATSDTEYELDVLIYATGFDAITEAFSAVDWRAKGGRPLLGRSDNLKGRNAVWVDHKPRTFIGLTAPDMPNMFMVLGPHQPFGSATRSIEHSVKVIYDLLQFCKDNEFSHVEPTQDAVDRWTEHVYEVGSGGLVNEVDTWMTGMNKNVQGKTTRSVARYAGSAVQYRKLCEECISDDWEGLEFHRRDA